MTDKVKLFNKGKRVIHYGNPPEFGENGKMIPDPHRGKIKPNEGVAFHPDIAKKLKRLYPKELLSLDDVREQFEKDTSEAASTPDMQAIVNAAVEKAVAAALEAERAKTDKSKKSSKKNAPEESSEDEKTETKPEETDEERAFREELEAEAKEEAEKKAAADAKGKKENKK